MQIIFPDLYEATVNSLQEYGMVKFALLKDVSGEILLLFGTYRRHVDQVLTFQNNHNKPSEFVGAGCVSHYQIDHFNSWGSETCLARFAKDRPDSQHCESILKEVRRVALERMRFSTES